MPDRVEVNRLASKNAAQEAPRYLQGVPLGRRSIRPLVGLGVRNPPLYLDPDPPHSDSTMQLHEEAVSTVVEILSSLTPSKMEPEQRIPLNRPPTSSVVPARGRIFANGQGQSSDSGESPSIWTIGPPHHASGDDAPPRPDASSEMEDVARQSRGSTIDVSLSLVL
jgi:hypothetical protein